MEALIIIALLVLLALAFVGILILVFLYFSLRSQTSRQIAAILAAQNQAAQQQAATQFQQWRENEIDAVRKEQAELAHQQALAQLEQWRGQELDLSRKQQLETARSEAGVQLEQWKVECTQSIRQDAIMKSQAVTVGKVTEHFVPYLPEFKYNPKDARFLGSPVDLVVFDGLNDGEIKGIVFIEVKTGTSALSTRERHVRDAVQSGKVQWMEIRPQLEVA